MKLRKIKKETLKHNEAFEYYLALGDERSLNKVAKKFNVAPQSVGIWSTSFDWTKRIEQRERELAIALAKKTDRDILNDKINYRRLIQSTISKYIDALESGEVDTPTIKELNSLIVTDLKIMDVLDNGTANVFNNNAVSFSNETSNTLDKILADLENMDAPDDYEDTEDENDEDFDDGGV